MARVFYTSRQFVTKWNLEGPRRFRLTSDHNGLYCVVAMKATAKRNVSRPRRGTTDGQPQRLLAATRLRGTTSPALDPRLPKLTDTAKIVRFLCFGKTGRAAAEILDLHPSLVYRVMAGERGLSIELTYRWAKLLGITFDQMHAYKKALKAAGDAARMPPTKHKSHNVR
jgi:hypothetical protein